MIYPKFCQRLPGYIAKGLMILVTAFWTYWGFGEMYHEGWWGAWYNPLLYLIVCTVCLTFTLVSLKWPRVGGWMLITVGAGFSLWWWGEDLIEGHLSLEQFFGQFPLSGSLVIIGVLFLQEARLQQRLREQTEHSLRARPWWRRNLWYILSLGSFGAIALGFSAYMLPVVLTRVDDGDRGARLIAGNDVTLIWAPEGPGWNWKQPWGGYPSWQSVALYGMEPVGMDDKPGYGWQVGKFATVEDMAQYNLCRYLSEDGLTLMETPQDIWRMPTVDDYVRSFARHGENAGCAWHGEYMEQVTCDILPDKETPLWAPDLAPIYYWAFEEYNEREAYFVSYNSFVNATRKTGGNPRHSYRCVKEP
ncbi:MAG: hypothetical protein JXA33_06510 [Anaerolineae bacterium]|nr:hypothetical protein [Anaerolineae bacterium]